MATRTVALPVPDEPVVGPASSPVGWLQLRVVLLPLLVVAGLFVSALVGAFAAVFPLVAVAAALLVLFAVRTLGRPHIATLVVVGLIYSNAVVVAVRIHGVPESVQYLIPLLLAVPIADRVFRQREPLVLARSAAMATVFLLAQMASTVAARDPARAMEGLKISALEGIALFLLLVNAIGTPAILRKAAWVVLLSGAALGAVAAVDAATGYDRDFGGFAQAGTDPRPADTVRDVFAEAPTPRVGGSIGETNRFAQVLLIAVGLGVAFSGQETSLRRRRVAAALTASAACGVILTFSRGGAVALAIILVGAIVMKAIRAPHVVVPVLVLALVLVAVPEYRDRLTSITDLRTATDATVNEGEGDGSIRSRATENLAALGVFLDHPLLGVGPDLFPTYYPEYAKRVGIRVKPGEREAHNLYLDVAAEFGAIGLFAFGGVVWVAGSGLRRARRSRDSDLRLVSSGLLLGLAGYLIAALFLHFSFVRYFWLIIGLAGAASVLDNVERAAEKASERRGSRGAKVQTKGSSVGSMA